MIKKILAIGAALAASLLAAAVAAPPATGPVPLSPTATAPAAVTQTIGALTAKPETHEITGDDLRAFLDGLVPYALHRADIAGATFVVVRDGKIIFTQGYGYADLKKQSPVIPDQTLFRAGSVSKLFTWTAVMQLVEQGKIDLDKDVNTYIDFKIPEKFGRPITMRNLMTHTAGFEETVSELFLQRADQQYPIGEYLKRHMPQRIFPPGKVVAYSNYGATLAGYIVQRVSGEEFTDYVANHIFKPLGMNHSTFKQLPPPELLKLVATGYMQASDPKPVPYEIVEAAPAGSLATTATDMARFMMAQMNGGEYDGARILKPETVKEMHTRNYSLAPGLNGFDLGFYEEDRNGHHIIGHAGDSEAFHSDLHLILDANTGIFMSFSSVGRDGAAEAVRTAIFRAFLDRYFPFTPPVEKTITDPSADNARVAGYYVASRRKESALSLLWQLGQTEVTIQPDNSITVDAFKDPSGAAKKWREVGPLDYREVGGQTHLKFVTTSDGSIDYLASDDFIPVELLQRVSGLEQLSYLKLFGMSTMFVCLLTVAIWFGGWIVRRRFDRPLELTGRQRQLRLASRLGAVLFLAVIAGWVGLLSSIQADEALLLGGALNPWIGALYVTGLLALLGGTAMIANGVVRIANGPGGWLVRAGDLVLALAGLWGIWAIFAYGFANFQFNI